MSVTKCASVVSSKFILQQTEHRTITVTAAIMQAYCCTTDWRILSTAVCNCHLLPSFANNTAIEMFLHIGNGANCWQDVYHWGTVVVVVTVRVRDIGQNVILLTQVSRWDTNQWASPSPSQYKGSCLVFITTTERLALDLSGHYLPLFFRERTVNTFWQTSAAGSTKCLHTEMNISRQLTSMYLLQTVSPWAAIRYADSQEIPHILCNPNVHYGV